MFGGALTYMIKAEKSIEVIDILLIFCIMAAVAVVMFVVFLAIAILHAYYSLLNFIVTKVATMFKSWFQPKQA